MQMDKNPIGRVLVVGGGVAGIQASLDLAAGGFKVYLLESKDAIGGTMAQLDKTFPTNDCSMCILSPKLVEVGSNPNIELLTRSRILKVEGEAPHFKVTVLREPRYVDLEKCKGCGDCAKECPVFLPNDYEEKLSQRRAIFRLYEQAVPSSFGITKLGISPCRGACPLHVNAQGYIQLISKGKYREALSLVREKNPFPLITGRICTRPCEKSCTRKDVDQSVAIDYLKRFISDLAYKEGEVWAPEVPPLNGKKVGIIGSGPAGLLAAYDLSLKGYKVSVFEKMPKIGGMLRYGIPPYRLPREILDFELSLLSRMGVEFNTSTEIRSGDFERLKREFDALFVAIGAWRSKKMGVPGEDLPQVTDALTFLREASINPRQFEGKAAVIGGGNSAIDAARTLLRLGAGEVWVIYRRTRNEMPADPQEVEEAELEGVRFQFLSAPLKIEQSGSRAELTIQRMRLGEPDSSGRPRPVPIPGAQETLTFDLIVSAIGQEPEVENLPLISEKGLIKADPLTLETGISGVFAGGDAVLGPSTFIESMAQGRKAANSIDRYLRGEDLREGREEEGILEGKVNVDLKKVVSKNRSLPQFRLPPSLKGDFSEVNLGLSPEDIKSEAERCLNCAGCSECMECVRVCEAKAIEHDMKPVEEVLEVGSVVLAPGFDEFDPSSYFQYGWGRFPNVVTSIQFERILSASGPFSGVIQRPGDGKHPKKIAFIQCVGSRDRFHPYCSSVCCMYATKEAVIAKEHSREVEATIFYIDIRSFGKDFEKYIERAKSEYGVRYVRSRVSSVEELEDGSLLLLYEDENGKLQREIFDLVVLSVGLEPPKSAEELGELFGLTLDETGFPRCPGLDPVISPEEGVFIAGAFSGPKDIPESVTEGSSAAEEASRIIAQERGKEISRKELPPEIDVRSEKPRVGVFICHCGLNIAGFLDVKAVTEFARNLPYVAYAESNLYTCSQDTQQRIKEKILEYGLNRVVVASCTPRTHEALFQETIREAGLNRFLFQMANIRDQDSWVHQFEPERATKKAMDLVKSAVAMAVELSPLEVQLLPITRRGLVIGGGISGMTAALGLADQGFEVVLVEKEPELGGNARHIAFKKDGSPFKPFLDELREKVKNHERVKVFTNVQVENSEGYVGNFKTTLSNGEIIEHGAVIIATGAEEIPTFKFGRGTLKGVITQRELESAISSGNLGNPQNLIFIQCVDSRDEDHPYCSRVCCQEALKNSIKVKELSPETEVIVLYRDIRSYGLNEALYTKAREAGVLFLNYEEEEPPEVYQDGTLRVRFKEVALQRKIDIPADMVVLSVGIRSNPENERLAKLFKVPLNSDGFFLEAHAKLRPVEFSTDGVFLAGLAHSPRTVEESIAQAKAAAGKAAVLLSKEGIEAGGRIARVNERVCAGCGLCELLCSYGAIKVIEKKVLGLLKRVAEVNPSLCKGCGACSGGCRSSAIDLEGFSNQQISEALEAILEI
ncbi:MAG: FAD-dependent oxidoreductase [Caldiserica bacterium]|nr:FAD-dependent oxidoreductase [Caldisericota bacterium]MDH7561794.1 FAD-dependent oxidoreductase [Caldisericota bacterium]